jgi:hypothetical protein
VNFHIITISAGGPITSSAICTVIINADETRLFPVFPMENFRPSITLSGTGDYSFTGANSGFTKCLSSVIPIT